MLSKFKEWEEAIILKQCGKTVEVNVCLLNFVLRHETTVPYSPQQNGVAVVAERTNRTIQETTTNKRSCEIFSPIHGRRRGREVKPPDYYHDEYA